MNLKLKNCPVLRYEIGFRKGQVRRILFDCCRCTRFLERVKKSLFRSAVILLETRRPLFKQILVYSNEIFFIQVRFPFCLISKSKNKFFPAKKLAFESSERRN